MAKRKNRPAGQGKNSQRSAATVATGREIGGGTAGIESGAEHATQPGRFAKLQAPAPPVKRLPLLLASILLWCAFLAFLLIAAIIG